MRTDILIGNVLLLSLALLTSPYVVEVPEGNHRVTVVVGDDSAAAETSVYAELRRLYLDRVRTGRGESLTRTFIVNVRRPEIAGAGQSVRLKPRETTTEAEAWDSKLTLRWTGSVRSVKVEPAPDVPTLFLAGDSTVADQPADPFGSWGQFLTAHFGPDIAVANHSESGESARSFLGERRWAKLLSVARSGDYLLIQFGHNDQKVATLAAYKADLTRFVTEARTKGVTPMLVTSVQRRELYSLGGFPDAMREVAREHNVPLIDLNALSIEVAGKESNFAPGDATHHSPAGAAELAKIVANSIRSQNLPLAKYLNAVPKTWIDPDTGHRVVRLTDEPGSASLYFNQNGYTPSGKRLVYTTPDGISALELATGTTRQVVKGRVRLIDAGRKYERVYYIKENAVWYTDIDTLESKRVAALPPRGGVATINADETLVAGTYVEGDRQAPYAAPPGGGTATQGHSLEQPLSKGQMMEQRWAARLPMGMFTMNLQTGEVKTIHKANDWLNHLLFSPTDPNLLMFCHEGPWHKVDRIWTIRTDGSQLTKIHTRTMAMEIFGHEFWSADGKTIWYDLQTPRGEDFWLAAYNLETKRRTWYHLQRNEWSIHFNVSRDGKLFCGDGGDPGQVARAPDGQWIYLFRPELIENRGIDNPEFVQPGVLRAEKLVNMSKHNYRLEPNVSFTPDRKWVVFRSNMFGSTYVFAAEVEKTK